MKFKKYVLPPIIVMLCIIVYVFISTPTIETRTWVLSYAQQAKPPYKVVAHNGNQDFSDVSLFEFSKPVEVTLDAKDGKLILTDITNGKTYEGSYKIISGIRFKNQSYSVWIDGVEGRANISSEFDRTLVVSIGDYCLNFEVK